MSIPRRLVQQVIDRDGGGLMSYDVAAVRQRLKRLSAQRGECREWIGSADRQGYGRITMRPAGVRAAHRVAWEIENGPIPDGLVVRHKCDNPPCVRIDHLELGTVADNNRDRVERRRSYDFRGVNNSNAKLDPAKVREVRVALSKGETQRSVADMFGVTQGTIAHIANRKTWAHVE